MLDNIKRNERDTYDVAGELNRTMTEELFRRWKAGENNDAEMLENDQISRKFINAELQRLEQLWMGKLEEAMAKSKRYVKASFGAGIENNINNNNPKLKLEADSTPIGKYTDEAYHRDREILGAMYERNGVTKEYLRATEEIGKKYLKHLELFLGVK